jgi:adenine C2-methylase RlmN of 23S rRNA A2503 and tRNA A37
MKNSCFISYSYDSKKHINWVERFAKKLKTRSKNSIEVHLDEFDVNLGDDLFKYMTDIVEKADYVIVICTPKYYQKFTGGVGVEKILFGSDLMKDAFIRKFIPVLKEGDSDTAVPNFLRTKSHITMLGKTIKTPDIDLIIKAIKSKKKQNSKSLKTNIYKNKKIKAGSTKKVKTMDTSRIELIGYSLLGGRGDEGIRYLWKGKQNTLVESLAFNTRIKAFKVSPVDKKISAYTTSVSFGCQLQQMNLACRFCATGNLKFKGPLTAEEIALQNIFMAAYDSNCPSWPEVRSNSREFAFMGQGEPGYHYTQIRRAIQLTDYAMNKLNQKVHRYIIASCGITDMLDLLETDLRNRTFKNKVSLHFSLHAVGDQRTELMPINKIFPFERFLSKSNTIANITKEKIAIGILLFENFKPRHSDKILIHSTEDYIEEILEKLDPRIHRIDLCDVNMNTTISKQHEVSNEKARKLLNLVRKKGFEGKLFSSFGANKESGCGMLNSSKKNIQQPGVNTMNYLKEAIEVLKEAIVKI